MPFYEVWGWNVNEDAATTFTRIYRQFYAFNALITLNWAVFTDAVQHLILPAVISQHHSMAIIARMTRSSMLEVLDQDYIRTARAKGLKRKSIIYTHAFRGALLPIVTITGQMGPCWAARC